MFSAGHGAGGRTALSTTKAKLELYERSWPAGIDTFRFAENQRRLVRRASRSTCSVSSRCAAAGSTRPDAED